MSTEPNSATGSAETIESSAPSAQRQRRLPGKPFAKGNPHAFKKGQSGNPQGMAVGTVKIIKDMFMEIGAQQIALTRDGKPTGEMTSKAAAVASVLYQKALHGDVKAAQYIADRLWGKAKEHVMVEPVMQKQFIIQRSTDVAHKQIDYSGGGNGNGGNGDDASVHPVA